MTGRIPRQQAGFLSHPVTVGLLTGSAFGLLGFMTAQGQRTAELEQVKSDVARLYAIVEKRTAGDVCHTRNIDALAAKTGTALPCSGE